MSRFLIVCIDGTWNSNSEKSEFFSHPTNVQRIAQLLVNDGERQRVLYLPGVGTRGFVDRMIGGVWGSGSTERVSEAYRFLCENYEEDDRIVLFGFSRGAFAVRSVTGLLVRVGLLRRDEIHRISEAVSLYRRPIRSDEPELFSHSYCHKILIHFIGVWDTVIRYGPMLAPFGKIVELALKRRLGLFDHRVPARVRQVCHALALDERRSAFRPWRFTNDRTVPGQIIEEMWFPGSHCDVGGGYPDSRVADLSFRWVLERAMAAGLAFHPFSIQEDGADMKCLHNSRVGIWRWLPWHIRAIQREDLLHESVHRLSLERQSLAQESLSGVERLIARFGGGARARH